MRTVGFSVGAHDVSFAIVENGIPKIHYELERYNRKKECHDDILKVFLDTGLADYADSAGTFCMHWNGGLKAMYPKSFQMIEDKYDHLLHFGHHRLHAANAFYSSNFDEALIITMDGGGTEEDGSDVAYTAYLGKDNKISLIDKYGMNRFNLGHAWGVIAKILLPNGIGNQSGTLMAMASFGQIRSELYGAIKDFIDGHSSESNIDGIIKTSGFNGYDVAATLQSVTDTYFYIRVDVIIKKYPHIKNLCFAGGVALNSVAIGAVQLKYPHLKIYVPPVPYDAGLAIGVGQLLQHNYNNINRVQWKSTGCTPYLGGQYFVEDNKFPNSRKTTDDEVINLLLEDKIVAVYGGRSESGRRALGNRSILANPCKKEMKDAINQKVKHRQSFRPFAPSILREEVSKYFIFDVDSPYMSMCIPFRSGVMDKVPAVVHKNGTGRLQTVTVEDNEWFYNFLKLWNQASGVPILLNTSFNDREPIVETPDDAYNCFMKTDIDYLYFRDDKLLISK